MRATFLLTCALVAVCILATRDASAQFQTRSMSALAFPSNGPNVTAPVSGSPAAEILCPAGTLSMVIQVPKSTDPNGSTLNAADVAVRLGPSTVSGATPTGIRVAAGGAANWTINGSAVYVASESASQTVKVHVVCGVL